jgi:hypothetical protein
VAKPFHLSVRVAIVFLVMVILLSYFNIKALPVSQQLFALLIPMVFTLIFFYFPEKIVRIEVVLTPLVMIPLFLPVVAVALIVLFYLVSFFFSMLV